MIQLSGKEMVVLEDAFNPITMDNINAFEDAIARAQLKKVAEYLKSQAFDYDGATFLPYRQVLEALLKEVKDGPRA